MNLVARKRNIIGSDRDLARYRIRDNNTYVGDVVFRKAGLANFVWVVVDHYLLGEITYEGGKENVNPEGAVEFMERYITGTIVSVPFTVLLKWSRMAVDKKPESIKQGITEQIRKHRQEHEIPF